MVVAVLAAAERAGGAVRAQHRDKVEEAGRGHAHRAGDVDAPLVEAQGRRRRRRPARRPRRDRERWAKWLMS
jgi:hypothetical protein